ncbi:hypothetical protein HM1_2917 [Heliomicrobium modesticaldum Ice1]|uniref:Uncharacterized protein n=1 Tax=Heliobacterium modesticaldum (strain ATCC 51547 / Ice1) TaxID=498761 RepID=B0TCX5_HELMI|nr:hypothetical protein HM1_2917 [Heliomicrobium modesticaldum Ice1]
MKRKSRRFYYEIHKEVEKHNISIMLMEYKCKRLDGLYQLILQFKK